MEEVRDKTFLSTPAEVLDPSRVVLLMHDPLTSIANDYGEDLIQATTPGFWEQCARLLTSARQNDLSVVYTQHSYDWEHMTGPWLRYLARNRTYDALRAIPFQGKPTPNPDAFVASLRPRPDEPIVIKTFHDAFQGTDLAERLRSQKKETIVLAGLGTESGIWGTARRGAAEGFYMVVVSDCVSGHPQLHADALTHLRSHFDVVDTETAITNWSS